MTIRPAVHRVQQGLATWLSVGVALVLVACSTPQTPAVTLEPSPTQSASMASLPQPGESPGRLDGWRADLDGILPAMERLHPDLYHGTSKADLAAAVADLRDAVPTASDNEMLVGLLRVVALVSANGRDAHTGAYIWGEGQPAYHSLPLRLWLFPEGVFVVDAAAPHVDLIGTQVVAIGGHPIDEIQRAIHPLIPRDNAATVQLLAPRFLLIPEILDGLGLLPPGPTIAVDVEDSTGATRTVALEPQTMDEYNEVHGAYGLHLPPTPDVVYLARPEEPLWSTRTAGGGTLYVGYNRVDGVSPAPLEVIREALTDSAITKVVIDIRQNYGGQFDGYKPLFEVLTAPSPQAQRGLFVVTGRNTFSAGSLFAAEVDRETDAIFVGEPMGGSPQFYANSSPIRLTWSGVEVSVATEWFDANSPADERLTIEPQLPAFLRATDYFARRDPAMEAIDALQ